MFQPRDKPATSREPTLIRIAIADLPMKSRQPNATLSGRCASIASARSAAAGSSTPEYSDAAKPISHDSRLRSFDDLVGSRPHRRWDRKTERLGGLEVDRKLKRGGLLDRQVGRLSPLENLVHIPGCDTPSLQEVSSV